MPRKPLLKILTDQVLHQINSSVIGCAGGRSRLQMEDQVLEDLWNIIQALKSGLTGKLV